MKNSKHNTGFESLDKQFNTKEVTKALEKYLEKTKEEKILPPVDLSQEDAEALYKKGELSDLELDKLAGEAEDSYKTLMDLGMNVDSRYSGRIFEVASTMLRNAIDAKSSKIDKKLKMVELQLKKLNIDKKQKAAHKFACFQGDRCDFI